MKVSPFATGLLAIGLAELLGMGAVAEPQGEAMRRVHFEVQRERPVETDRIQATLVATEEDRDAAKLAARLNETMQWALSLARHAESVHVRTGSYQTFPISQKGHLHHWRARQELILDSGDVEKVSALVGTLQERLQLGSVAFSVSPERRERVADDLIRQALEAARERAELVRQGLGAAGFRWIDLQIRSEGSAPPPIALQGRALAMGAEGAPPPALEGGTRTVRVAISATIQLEEAGAGARLR